MFSKNLQRNFIKRGGGQRPFINFIKKQEKWYVVPSLKKASYGVIEDVVAEMFYKDKNVIKIFQRR